MKLLVVADIHGDVEAAAKAAKYAGENQIDSVLILGDFPSRGGFRNFEASRIDTFAALEAFKGMKVYAIRGNCDSIVVKDLLLEKGVSIDGKKERIGDYDLLGFGGSAPSPYDSPNEMSEEEIYERLDSLMKNAGKKTILALHCPPKNTACDKTNSGAHAGSASSRKIIEEYEPLIALCSHIHEAGGTEDRIGDCVVANIGRISEGRIGILELNDRPCIELKKI